METFVLVHGAFHGAWCWQRVAAILQRRGAEVHTPCLTGLGQRVHEASREVGLAAHISDVVALMERKNVRGAVLVGHSYGGMVIAGAADRAPGRLSSVVYLDAYVPEDGQSLADLKGKEWLEGLAKRAEAFDGWRIPAPPAVAFDVLDGEDAAWAESLLRPHPVKTFTDRLALTNPDVRQLPHAYIACIDQDDSFMYMRERIVARGWEWLEIATGHDAMITAPRELTEMLVRLARGGG